MSAAPAAALVCLLLTVVAGCTGDSPEPAPEPSEPASTGSTATLQAKPVPLNVRVTRVSGKLGKAARAKLARKVKKPVAAYFDAAFLTQPGQDGPKAFGSFTPGAAEQARHDRGLLTNAGLGEKVVSITPEKSDAWLSVLAPKKVAAGVTAQVRLVFEANRDPLPDKRVTVTGRLLLTRARSGAWKIFGYDLARSVKPAGNGGR